MTTQNQTNPPEAAERRESTVRSQQVDQARQVGAREPGTGGVIRSHAAAGRIALIVLALLLTAGAITFGVVRWLPEWLAAAATQTSDGTERFGIHADSGMQIDGAVAVVKPGAGWSVRPAVPGGLQLRTPDRVMRVTLTTATDSAAQTQIDQDRGDAPLRTETLSTGLSIEHVTTDAGFTGVIDLAGDRAIVVRATVEPPAELTKYRGSLGEVLEAVTEP